LQMHERILALPRLHRYEYCSSSWGLVTEYRNPENDKNIIFICDFYFNNFLSINALTIYQSAILLIMRRAILRRFFYKVKVFFGWDRLPHLTHWIKGHLWFLNRHRIRIYALQSTCHTTRV
jgi:hypothetical protein